jgi:beta-phosphoglucomutase family hydrolase
MLRLPASVTACLFDLDGVLVGTATLHADAWKRLFDSFLRERAERTGEPFRPFESADYLAHVDGRLREDGVRSFLASRGIDASADTVHELAERKNELVLELIETRGVEVFDGSVRLVREAQAAGLRRAVVSASKNTRAVLEATGLAELFEDVVDGVVAEQQGLPGKPSPAMFLAAAARLGVEPAESAVFEDALAGVEAGRAGAFGCVVGVDRGAGAEALRAHGADVVVDDLAELEVWR